MELFIKRENWDGGIWLRMPADEDSLHRLFADLKEKHPSVMLPFIGDVKSPIKGLEVFLIGELAFEEDHLELLNQLAEKINAWSEQECAIFGAALQMENPDSIGEVLAVTEHLDQYLLHPDVVTWEQLGRFILKREHQSVPAEMERYFDYAHYGSLNMGRNERITAAGLVVKKEVIQEARNQAHENPIDPDKILPGAVVFHLSFPSHMSDRGERRRETMCLELPISDSELKQAGKKWKIQEIAGLTDYQVRSSILYLPDFLPPGCTVGELNQVARTIWEVCEREEMSRKKLLASLEAEVPRDIDTVCRIIRSHRDYAFLPIDILCPEDYAKYMLELHHIEIKPEMEIFYALSQFGEQKMKENGPVQTTYGVLVNKNRPIPEITKRLEEFRFYNSLVLSAYWNASDSFSPEILSGEAAVLYRDIIQEKIDKSLKDGSDRGLAEYLSNELLGRRVSAMIPGVEEYGGELWGVLTVKTFGELNPRELEALREEWKAMADGGWGEELFYRPIRTPKGEIYIGFWDTDNNSNLFIKTEAEFKQDDQNGAKPGQLGPEVCI